MVKIRLPVLGLKLIKVLFINPDLTMTFDPATLTLVQLALIFANRMCESYQDFCPPLATTKPKTSIVAYLTTSYMNLYGYWAPETVVD